MPNELSHMSDGKWGREIRAAERKPASNEVNNAASDSARRAAEEISSTFGLRFQEDSLQRTAAIISKHLAPAPADDDAESVALTIPTCGDCPFVDHSGAFTPGGAKAICGHRNAVETFAGDHGADWTYRQVDRDTAPPAQCPLRNPETAHVHEYHTIEGQSASECKCGAVYNWPTTKGDG